MGEFLFLLLIVIAKVVEVTVGTIRIVMITKGERRIGSILAFIEVVLWCVLAGTVLTNIAEAPGKIIAYSLGFAIGNYVGSLLEERIGIGLCEMSVILLEEHGAQVAKALRDAGYAVTQIKAQGKNHPREMLILYVPRNKANSCIETIRNVEQNAVITLSDKKPIYGGFGMLRR